MIVFISANTSGAGWCIQQSSKVIQGHKKGSEGPETHILELLMLKHDRAYLSVDSEESMCVIMKRNTVTRVAYLLNMLVLHP